MKTYDDPASMIRAMASKGYGWEDISVMLRIKGDYVRRIVLDEPAGKELPALRRAADQAQERAGSPEVLRSDQRGVSPVAGES